VLLRLAVPQGDLQQDAVPLRDRAPITSSREPGLEAVAISSPSRYEAGYHWVAGLAIV
jgi:hypothetical protein